ncbi:DUF4115 domain-containing protein [Agarivorans sp. TSD2052]|uniref:RodZ domain-containing protein n=1 Tax=Agarivorans sp. TSD2052 TaxID=2937286 RepID=UPI00200C9308|nr:RodZ domain-containing protein [Agarivorans sp. TSD2052]UPW17189.1 DUF4115 domain-containing protein [Agarivorans sp. TSD2052]
MTTKIELEPTELSEDIEVVSPGQMLQEARVAANLSQNQVAERLKLRLQVVVDIEADSFDGGLSVTFIKGYLRGYARLVNVSEELILSSYAHLNDAQEQRTEMQSFSGRFKQETHDSRLMKFTYFVAFGIVVLLVIWWWQEKNQQEEFAPQTSSNAVTDVQPSEPVAEVNLTADLSSSEAESVVAVDALEPTVVNEDSNAPLDLPSNADSAAIADLPSQASELDAPAETVAEPLAEVIVETPTEVADLPLSMSFEKECWVEIRDATGKRLVAAIKKAGDKLSVTGPAPYSIVLGTSVGVSVNYGQDKIDLSSFKNGKVVRMKIPN